MCTLKKVNGVLFILCKKQPLTNFNDLVHLLLVSEQKASVQQEY
jgi:hypothetical protein